METGTGKVFGEQELPVASRHTGTLWEQCGLCSTLFSAVAAANGSARAHACEQTNGGGRQSALGIKTDDGTFTRRQTGHRTNIIIIIIISARCVQHPTSFEQVFYCPWCRKQRLGENWSSEKTIKLATCAVRRKSDSLGLWQLGSSLKFLRSAEWIHCTQTVLQVKYCS